MKKGLLTLAIIASSALSFSTIASTQAESAKADFESASQAVEFRQEGFQTFRHHFGIMGDMMRGETAFDADVFAENATQLNKASELPWAGFHGLGHGYVGDGDAKPAVWSNSEKFDIYTSEFKQATAELVRYLDGESATVKGIRGSFAKVGRTCQQCHKDFRE